MVNKIRHTGIVVDDLSKSLRFYRDLLGFEVVKRAKENGPYIERILALGNASVTTVKMTSHDGQMIELLSYTTPSEKKQERKINDVGLSHIALAVIDIDCEYERLRKESVEFISNPVLSPDGYAKVAFCRAPEGTFIELVEVIRQNIL